MPEETDDVFYDVLGIGHALVDASFSVSETFLLKQGLPKGEMTLCDRARLEGLRAALPQQPESLSAGGSCSNTLALLGGLGGLGSLGALGGEDFSARYAFVGRVGDDAEGEDFRRSMEQRGIECRLEVTTNKEEAGKATGQCVVLVTRDAQRTFATHLGASSDIVAARLDKALLRRARCLYLEGYLLGGEQGRELFETAAASCKEASCVLSLSLSDPSCVSANRDFFLRFVHSEVDLLFANEEEGRELFSLAKNLQKAALREALTRCCSELGCRVCLTLGAEGALLFDGAGGVSVSAPAPARCVDTTGAGDAFAAGMLFGLSRGWSMERAGVLANGLGAAVTSEVGPRLLAELQPFLSAASELSVAP